MGFRCVFVTEDTDLDIPKSFYEKHKESYHFHVADNGRIGTPICSKGEYKWHGEIIEDLQKLLPQHENLDCTQIWECGGVEKILIKPDNVINLNLEYDAKWSEDNYGHSYCYGHYDEFLKK